MTRILVIVNPTSGRGFGEKAYPQIEQRLTELGVDFSMQRTQAAGHAAELAQQGAAEGYDVVAAAGGDGTANETINGLMQIPIEQRPALGLIPVGRGNDFGYGVGIPHDLQAACQVLASGQRKRIDVGRVVGGGSTGGDYPGGRYFGNGVGIGFDAVVGFEALKLTRLSGFPSYIVAALKTILLYFNAPTVRIEFESQELTQPALMVSIMNGRRLGGGFFMAPKGQMDDGWFDLCIAGQVSRLGILALIPRFMQGKQFGHPAIKAGQARRLTVTAVSGTLPAHADGETLCLAGERLELELIPAALDMIVPAGAPAGA